MAVVVPAARALLATAYAAGALAGVPVARPGHVLLGALVAASAGVALALGTALWAPGHPYRRCVPPTAGAVAGVVPFYAATGALGALGALLLSTVLGLVLLVGTALVLADVPPPARPPRPPEHVRFGAAEADEVRELLRALPLDVLCAEWTDGVRVLDAGTPGAATAVLQLRELLLDELQARDPAGCQRWLREAPDRPPDRYLRDDHDLTA